MKHVTRDMKHVTRDMKHVTRDARNTLMVVMVSCVPAEYLSAGGAAAAVRWGPAAHLI